MKRISPRPSSPNAGAFVVSPTPGQVMLLIRLGFAGGRIAALDVTGDPARIRATQVGVA